MSKRLSQYCVLLTREPASFWRENVIAVVTLLRVLARNVVVAGTSYQIQEVYHFAIGRGLNLL